MTGIKDVARAAGVSPATVSRVLGKGPVSGELRARVEQAVRATGYRPNLSARRLRSQDSGTVGVIVADIRNPFFTEVIRAVESRAYEAGLRLILCNTDEDPKKEAMYLQLMEEERVTGVILAPTQGSGHPLRQLRPSFPVALIDRAMPGAGYDSVVLDNEQAIGLLVDHLFAQGYRRIGGLFGNASATGIERSDGFLRAVQAHGGQGDARFAAPQAKAAQVEVMQWLSEASRPEAIIASNSLLLAGAIRASRAMGLDVPGQLGLAGFDNEPWTELVAPGITVIEQPVEVIGRTALTMLLERQIDPTLPIRRVVLSGRCVVRGSTAQRPAAGD